MFLMSLKKDYQAAIAKEKALQEKNNMPHLNANKKGF